MAKRVVLHVGLMKSGTSFIQRTLAANRAALRTQGVLFPGEDWSDQVRAVRDLLGRQRAGGNPERVAGAWPRMVDEIDAWPETAVVSMEFLASASRAAAARAVEAFGADRVHVVLTVRDLGRTVPAMWQEALQNYQTWTWDEYVEAVRRGDRSQPGPARAFWRQQSAAAIARRWSSLLPEGHVTLVTVPPPGTDPLVLWQRFGRVLDIDSHSLEPAPHRNESLGAASAQLMRELNVAVALRGVSPAAYQGAVKKRLAKTELSRHKAEEPAIGFAQEWARRRADRIVRALGRLPVTVVGDLEDLRAVPVPGVHPATVSDRQKLDAAVAGLAGVLAADAMPESAPPPEA